MKTVVLVVVHAVLQLVGSISCTTRLIKPHVLALEVSSHYKSLQNVPLHCVAPQLHGEDIRWRKNGQSIPESGNNITVQVEGFGGGNFSCHGADGNLLNYTLVLVHQKSLTSSILQSSRGRELISCTARNYSGQFNCSWKWHQDRKDRAVVDFTVKRNSSHINCTLNSDISGLTCVDQYYCPFSEEATNVTLTLLLRNLYRLEERSKTFLISFIVKPDKVRLTSVHDDEFKWGPAETWNFPCSYFPLYYEVKVVPDKSSCDARIKTNETNDSYYKVNMENSYTFCVRAQDQLTSKVWSDWSHHYQPRRSLEK